MGVRVPLPPADLATRRLPIHHIVSDRPLYRVHSHAHGPIYFGKGPVHRFDSPTRAFGVLYLGKDLRCAFVETLLRDPRLKIVSQAEVDARRWSVLVFRRRLRLAMLFGPGLQRVGTTAGVSTGTLSISRAWAQALHDHRDAVDGIAYQSRHDNAQRCVALFERAGDTIRLKLEGQTFDPAWLDKTLELYGKAWIA